MLKQINKRGNARAIDEVKKISGYLMGVRFTPAKGKPGTRGYRAPSPIYVIQDKKTGERSELWGCAIIDANLLQGNQIDAALHGVFVSLKFDGLGEPKKGQQPPKLVTIMADTDDTIKAGKGAREYRLRK